MADPRTMHLDTLTRRWDLVAELVHCHHCLGALPPDVDGACEECGTGTPAAPPVTIRMVQGTFTPTGPLTPPAGSAVPDEGHVHIEADAPVSEPTGWMAMLKSWARWPNV